MKNQKPFKYEIGQVIVDMTITYRWHGKELNFYDVVFKSGYTWTYDEEELDDLLSYSYLG